MARLDEIWYRTHVAASPDPSFYTEKKQQKILPAYVVETVLDHRFRYCLTNIARRYTTKDRALATAARNLAVKPRPITATTAIEANTTFVGDDIFAPGGTLVNDTTEGTLVSDATGERQFIAPPERCIFPGYIVVRT